MISTQGLPSSIYRLTNLSRLSLSSCSFPSVPSFANNRKLREIEIVTRSPLPGIETALTTVPQLETLSWINVGNTSTLGSLTSLRSLTLKPIPGFQVSLPDAIGNLSNLTSFAISFGVAELPTTFYNLSELRSLTLDSINMGGVTFSPALTNLKKLEKLVISGSRLGGALPPLSAFPNLSAVSITGGTLPLPDISGAVSLESLTLMSQSSSQPMPPVLPPGTPNLRTLSLLGLAGSLPTLELNSTVLTRVAIQECNVSSLADSLFGPSLETLILYRLPALLPDIPSGLVLAANLTSLSLAEIPFSGVLPAPVGGYPRLEYLAVSTTLISDVAPSFSASPSLISVVLVGNKFRNFPMGFIGLPKLSSLAFVQSTTATEPFPNLSASAMALRTLQIKGAKFNGTLPSYLVNLDVVSIENTQMSGFLSASLLERLNDITWNSNSGGGLVFPAAIAPTCRLKNLAVVSAALNYSFPKQICNCKQLLKLDMHNNSLTGQVPRELLELPRIMTIDLSSNDFSSIENFKAKPSEVPIDIKLGGNRFNGPLSPEMIETISTVGTKWSLQANGIECPRQSIGAALASYNKTFPGEVFVCTADFRL